ncbi:MAG: class I SAM-dependent methyltransferase [Myxococcales bacterium]|nr:class I SAM-dependent methyltransferase [Myxococcales bacterium]
MPKKSPKPARKTPARTAAVTKKTASRKASPKKTAKKAARATLAQKADKHALYQVSVQSPGVDIQFFSEQFEHHRGRKPMRLREDFCGTAHFSTEWCKSDPERTALGVDLDGPTLAWGRQHNLGPAGARVAGRVKLAQADVRETRFAKVDLTLAMNFSYCVFKTREDLGSYFAAAHKSLVKDGILALEVYGGTESNSTLTEERKVKGGATYIWEQEKFCPIDHHFLCHISWRFKDRSKLHRAFTYDWRLWTLPELRELMLAAGFRDVKFYFEKVDGDEGDEYMTGTGEYVEHAEIDNQEAWLAYVLALK